MDSIRNSIRLGECLECKLPFLLMLANLHGSLDADQAAEAVG
jgi:hypothetical protein